MSQGELVPRLTMRMVLVLVLMCMLMAIRMSMRARMSVRWLLRLAMVHHSHHPMPTSLSSRTIRHHLLLGMVNLIPTIYLLDGMGGRVCVGI